MQNRDQVYISAHRCQLRDWVLQGACALFRWQHEANDSTSRSGAIVAAGTNKCKELCKCNLVALKPCRPGCDLSAVVRCFITFFSHCQQNFGSFVRGQHFWGLMYPDEETGSSCLASLPMTRPVTGISFRLPFDTLRKAFALGGPCPSTYCSVAQLV